MERSSGALGSSSRSRRPERLAYNWTWDGHAAHEGTNLVEVEFRDLGDGTTLVVLTNSGLPDEDAKGAHREGWDLSLENLDRLLSG